VKVETSGYFGSGQAWTLPDAYNITLDVYPPYQRYRRVYPPNRRRADRASSAATNHALQLGATDLEYEVTRVKSPVIGRDMNPMGRGDGAYYCNGGNSAGASIAIRGAKPSFMGEVTSGLGIGKNNVSLGCTFSGRPEITLADEEDDEERRREAIEKCVESVHEQYDDRIRDKEALLARIGEQLINLIDQHARLLERFRRLRERAQRKLTELKTKKAKALKKRDDCIRECNIAAVLLVPPWKWIFLEICYARCISQFNRDLQKLHSLIDYVNRMVEQLWEFAARIKDLKRRIEGLYEYYKENEEALNELIEERQNAIDACYGKPQAPELMVATATPACGVIQAYSDYSSPWLRGNKDESYVVISSDSFSVANKLSA